MSVKKWVMSDEWWVMSYKWWVMSDKWWVMEIKWWKLSDEKSLPKQVLSDSAMGKSSCEHNKSKIWM